jgi:hypothetical protein
VRDPFRHMDTADTDSSHKADKIRHLLVHREAVPSEASDTERVGSHGACFLRNADALWGPARDAAAMADADPYQMSDSGRPLPLLGACEKGPAEANRRQNWIDQERVADPASPVRVPS